MARYFLHLRQGTDEALDEEGTEVGTFEALKAKVLAAARDTMSHDLREGRLLLYLRIDAEDEAGNVAYTLPFADALCISYA
jgi:hypothetical protein